MKINGVPLIPLYSARSRPSLGVGRAVDNALTLFRVWPFKDVGAILGHANAAAYADNMHGCGKLLPLQFFKCKFENFLMVVSTMCPHLKVAELNTLSGGKGITGIHIPICQ